MSADQSAKIAKLQTNVSALSKSVQEHYGTIAALEGAIHTLVSSHPNPAELQKQLAGGLEIVEALFLGGSKSDAGLAAFQAARKRIDDSCRQSLAHQPPGK